MPPKCKKLHQMTPQKLRTTRRPLTIDKDNLPRRDIRIAATRQKHRARTTLNWLTRCAQPPALHTLGAAQAGLKDCVDGTGCDGVHPDGLGHELDGKRAGEGDHGARC